MVKGFCDLMVEVENDRTFGSVKQREMEDFLKKLGYSAVAFNVSVTAPLQKHHTCQIDISNQARAQKGKQGTQEEGMHKLTRITVSLEDTAHAHAIEPTNAIVSGYDIIAVRPLAERVFELSCKSLKVHLISLDLAHRLPFHLKPSLVKAALDRGLHFEITYAPALRDVGARRVLLANAQALVRASRGRGLVISSGAAKAMELRGPLDVVNLSALFSLGHGGPGHAAIAANPAAVAAFAVKGRRGGKVAGVVPVSQVPPEEQWSVVPQGQRGRQSQGEEGEDGGGAGEEEEGEFMALGASSEEEESGDGEEEEGEQGGGDGEGEEEEAAAAADEEEEEDGGGSGRRKRQRV